MFIENNVDSKFNINNLTINLELNENFKKTHPKFKVFTENSCIVKNNSQHCFKFSINKHLSTKTREIIAILKSLEIVMTFNSTKNLILTDSKSTQLPIVKYILELRKKQFFENEK